MRIACPHCQVAIEVVDTAPESELTCPSCGSRVERALATTLIVSPAEAAELDRINEELKQAELATPAKPENAAPVPPSPPKRMFGRYELQSLLGRGAFGEVWKAFDTIDGRHVALKLLRSQSEVKPGEEEAAREARQRFEREARTLSRIEHPGVVRLYKFGEIDGRLYLASELIEGLNLQMLVKRMRANEHSLTHKEAAQLCGQVAEALHAAHEVGIVHRDLKPANILMDTNGLPHVADFGLAKREDRAEYTMTQDHTVLGTPEYMSPEQWRDSHTVGPASDIYSLGVILYELLTGRVPFPCTTDKWILLRDLVLKEEPIAPRRLSVAIPIGLESICLKCLEKDPARRFTTAAELSQELSRFVRGTPVITPAITRVERVWRWCQRKPVTAALSAAVVISMLAGTIISTIFGFDANEKRKLADKKTVAASEAEQRKSEALKEVTVQKSVVQRTLARRMVEHAVQEFQADRVENGRHELLQAFEMTADDDPLRDSIRRLLSGWTMRREIMIHPTEIRAMAVSPDGQHFAVTSGDSNVWLWNLETKSLVADPLRHDGDVTSLAFSHDGALLLTGSTDRTARLWKVATRMLQTAPFPHRERVTAVAFAPDDSWFAIGTPNSLVWIWDRQLEQLRAVPLGEFPADNPIRTIAVSAKGDLLAAADSYGGATIWNVRDGKEQCRVRHEKFVTSMTFSLDGRFLIAGSDDNSVRFWNVVSGKNERTLKHDYQVTSLATIRNGQALLTGTSDRKVRLWNLNELPQPVEALDQVFLPIRIEDSGDDGDESEPIKQRFPPTFNQPPRTPPTPHEVEPAGANIVGYEREWILDSSVVQVAESSKTGEVLIAANSGIIWRTVREDVNARQTPTQHFLDGGVVARTKSATRIVRGFENKNPELHQIWRLTDDDNPELEIKKTQLDNDTRKLVAGYPLLGSFGVFTRTDSESALGGQFTKADDLVFFSHAADLSTFTAIVSNRQNEVFAWNMRTNQPSSDPLRLSAPVQRVILDPSGQRAILSCADGTLRSWTPRNGLALEIHRKLSAEIIDLAVSEDGHIVACVTRDGRIETWRTDRFDPQVLNTRVSFVPSKVGIGRNGELLAVGGEDGKVAIISASTLTLREVQGASGGITHLEFDLPGTCLAATSKNELSFVYFDDESNSELIVHSTTVDDSVFAGACFVTQEREAPPTLMTVFSNGRISTWQRYNGLPKQTVIAHLAMDKEAKNGLTGASIAKDGQRIIAFRSAGVSVVQVCETTSRELVSISLSLNRMPVVNDRGLVIGLMPSNGLQTWRMAGNPTGLTISPLTSSIERSSSLECLRSSINGQRLAIAFHDSPPISQFPGSNGTKEVRQVSLLSESDEAKSPSECFVFDTSDFAKPVVSFRSENPLRLARFDAQSKLLLTADIDGGVSIWDLDRAAKQSQLQLGGKVKPAQRLGNEDPTPKAAIHTEIPSMNQESAMPSVLDAAIAPNGKWFVVGCSDKVVRVHSTENGQERFPPLKHADQVAAVSISPNSDLVASASLDDSVGIWNSTTGERIALLPHRDDVVAVSFSSDGSLLLTGSSDMTAQFWDTRTWKPRGNPLMHGNTVTSVAFSADGKLALTSSWDRTVRLWDVVTGLPICEPMPHELPVEQASFFPDGTAILANCSHGLSRVWRVPTPEARDLDALKLQVEVETGMVADSNSILRRLTHAEWQQRSSDLLSGLGKKN